MSENVSELVDTLIGVEAEQDPESLSKLIETQSSDEIALALESLPLEERYECWNAVPSERRIDVLVSMRSDPRTSLIALLEHLESQILFDGCDAEILIELSDSLPTQLLDRALDLMDEKQKEFYAQAQQYSENEIVDLPEEVPEEHDEGHEV